MQHLCLVDADRLGFDTKMLPQATTHKQHVLLFEHHHMTALRELRPTTFAHLARTGKQQVASRVLRQFLGGETEILDMEISTNVHTELKRRSYWTLKAV